MLTRHQQYQACQERGHDADEYISNTMYPSNENVTTKGRCRYCQTWFWVEEIIHEEGAPTPQPIEHKQ